MTAVLERITEGRIEVVEGGRIRRFGPADADLRAVVLVNDPGRLARRAARQRRPRRGLRRRPLGDRRPGRADPDRRPRAARPRRPARRCRPAARPPPTGSRRLVPENTRRRRPREHLRPLRPRQRPLRRLPRPADDVLLRLLPGRAPASLEEAQTAKLERICRRLRLGPGRPPAGDRQRLGRARDPRRPPARLPGDYDDDLPAPARPGDCGGSREAGLERPGRRCCSRTTATSAARYDRLVSVEMIEAVGWQYFDDLLQRRCDGCWPRTG